jgi:thiosulfate/3-mercaptopyruvate sulfurtransferase
MSHFPLVSAQWLKGALNDPSVVILDATYHLPNVKRDAEAEFNEIRIPGAQFFSVDGVCDPTDPLPHMIPSPEAFGEMMGALVISNDTHVVCYDSYGIVSAARPWWMFRLFGHEKVSVLDGGLPAWKAAGYPTESGPALAAKPAEFTADFRPELLRRVAEVQANLEGGAEVVLDARAANRFDGSAPEPRAGMRSGHIPGSLNLPHSSLMDADTKKMISIYGLQSAFQKAGVRLGRDKVVTSCGSGVSACILVLALHLLGDDTAAVYDGSWSEWGTRSDTPITNPSDS